MVTSEIPVAAGFFEEAVAMLQGTLTQALPKLVEFIHQPIYGQIFSEHWLCPIQCHKLGLKQGGNRAVTGSALTEPQSSEGDMLAESGP